MTWIIGDIHGCRIEIESLLDLIPPSEELIFLGDYIDRGPDSFGVIELMLKNAYRSSFIMGNHESMMMAYFQDSESAEGEAFLFNGGRETIASYGLNGTSKWLDFPEAHRNFFENLLLFVERDNFIAVHAGVNIDTGTDMAKQSKQDLLWLRHEWIQRESMWSGKKVYYGHTPIKRTIIGNEIIKPKYGKKSICLDTGCVYGGYLSTINPATNEVIQIQSSFGL